MVFPYLSAFSVSHDKGDIQIHYFYLFYLDCIINVRRDCPDSSCTFGISNELMPFDAKQSSQAPLIEGINLAIFGDCTTLQIVQ